MIRILPWKWLIGVIIGSHSFLRVGRPVNWAEKHRVLEVRPS
ncbi:hypothetical protein LINGRAHAP2_LOCUS30868 [Linum grandiflorum]